MTWTQNYDPFGHWWLSTLCAALPIIVLFVLLAGLRVRPHLAALAGATPNSKGIDLAPYVAFFQTF